MEVMTISGYAVNLDKSDVYAAKRLRHGDKPTFSSGLECELTCGYGKLDEWGYWEYPLYIIE